MRKHLLLGASTLLLAATASAQTTGIRMIIPQFDKTFQGRNMWSPGLFGLGVDRDLTDRFSLGLDATFSISGGAGTGSEVDVSYGGYSAYYMSQVKSFKLQYRTEYAFGDNDETHFYLGSFFAVRSLKQLLDLEYYDYTGSNAHPFVDHAEAKNILVPVGLRLGVRGSLESWYADLYVQVGYTIGAGESKFTQSYLKGEGFDLSKFALTAGFAYGFGW